jgi:hypothetical protein
MEDSMPSKVVQVWTARELFYDTCVFQSEEAAIAYLKQDPDCISFALENKMSVQELISTGLIKFFELEVITALTQLPIV